MPDESWHLSKSVPLTLVFAIICQTVAIIWFAASLRNDIDSNAEEIIRLDARTSSLEVVVQSQAITLARIDENIKGIRDYLERVKPE
jgi:hypothetical protein